MSRAELPASVISMLFAALAVVASANATPPDDPPVSLTDDAFADDAATGLARTGFLAEHVVRDPDDGLVRQLTRVEFSVHGRRITQIGGAGQRLLINDDLERLWLIDRRRRIVHEVPLVAGESAPTGPTATSPVADGGHVFELSPCARSTVGSFAPSTWRGRSVVVADCVDSRGRRLSTQTFDAEVGVVVRIERAGGGVEELRSIEPLSFGPDHFLPAPTLREVGIDELLGGAAPVGSYAEP